MSSKKRTSSRAAKLRQQTQARTTRTPAPKTAPFQDALEALTRDLAAGHLQVLCPDGQVRQLTYDRLREQRTADLARLNERFGLDFSLPQQPAAAAQQIAQYLADDLLLGAMSMRNNGV
ncbi:hypothetical protein E6R18_24860 [Streptomyces sp. A1277]|uniref:hypothetical protein n=1 Tax=Streptomyces sp. A1277 TaxID=2563103 RepID=UPI0010A24179|nr:hypothetical protein [Streptomyces sp. A1277]THA29145.1 hypothetical protein E6R18_24860 [Streptomyces sp. A1277]